MTSVSETSDLSDLYPVIQTMFMQDWYVSTYRAALERHARPEETPFDFYLRMGARMGHDPHPYFCEIHYRAHTPGVLDWMRKSRTGFGFAHYLRQRADGMAGRLASQRTVLGLRKLLAQLDGAFILREASGDLNGHVSPADFYYAACSAGNPVDPNPHFSERYYLQAHSELRPIIHARPDIISGYQHYLQEGCAQGRAILSPQAFKLVGTSLLPQQGSQPTNPSIIRTEREAAAFLDLVFRDFDIKREPHVPDAPGLVVVLTNQCAAISLHRTSPFFEFLKRLKAQLGTRVRLLFFDDAATGSETCKTPDEIWGKDDGIFDEVHVIAPWQTTLPVPVNAQIISPMAETHFVASQVAQALGRKPYFFTQTDEAALQSSASMAGMVYSAKSRPHIGIFSSTGLARRLKRSGNYPTPRFWRGDHHVAYDSRLQALECDQGAFQNKHQAKKKCVFLLDGGMASGQKLFGFALSGLRRAIALGAFEGGWDFVLIDAQGHESVIDLGLGRVLKQTVIQLPDKKQALIERVDVGVSLNATAVPNHTCLQMAASGVVTVSNTAPESWAHSLRPMSRNLRPVPLVMDHYVTTLCGAVEASANLPRRFRNARATKACYDDKSQHRAIERVARHMNRQATKTMRG